MTILNHCCQFLVIRFHGGKMLMPWWQYFQLSGPPIRMRHYYNEGKFSCLLAKFSRDEDCSFFSFWTSVSLKEKGLPPLLVGKIFEIVFWFLLNSWILRFATSVFSMSSYPDILALRNCLQVSLPQWEKFCCFVSQFSLLHQIKDLQGHLFRLPDCL